MSTPPPPATVQYHAVSILTSRTILLNMTGLAIMLLPPLIEVLSDAQVRVLIPARWMPLFTVVILASNAVLRTITVRPVAFIAPGETKIVDVPKLDPPKPPIVSD
jgi:hypothetical protein